MAKLIGFSLSRCVNDIAGGRIAYEDVEKIVARTAWDTESKINDGLAAYRQEAWVDHQDQAVSIARRLFNEGKVEQPRLTGGGMPQLPGGNFHWMDSQTKEIITSPELNEAAAILEADRSWGIFGATRKPGEKGSPNGLTVLAIG